MNAKNQNLNAFEKLGRTITRHRRLVVIAWILVLAVTLPFVVQEGKVVTLNEGSSTGSTLESVQASNIINAEFAKSVPNSTLLLVIQSTNVSSPATQNYINATIRDIKTNSSLVGVQNVTSVYTYLYSILNQTNSGTRSAFTSANKTNNLLLGVPGLYLEIWGKAFNGTNLEAANFFAYNQTKATLELSNATAYTLYSSHVLSLFNQSWANSFETNLSFTFDERAEFATHEADLEYVNTYMSAGASRNFGLALVGAFNFSYLNETSPERVTSLANFAVNYVVNQSGFSTEFVNATYTYLGSNLTSQSLEALAGNIVWNPALYNITPNVKRIIGSFVDSSRNTTFISIGLNQSLNSNIVNIRSIAKSNLAQDPPGGVSSALLTGSDAVSYDFGQSTTKDLGIILPVTLILLIVATGLFFRSALTPFITLGTIGVALGISQIFIVLVGTFVAKVDFTIPTILLTILIGVGTDYSVFIIARYLEERVRGLSVEDALLKSITYAGESIATSGATVIISFLSLNFSTVTYLRTIGIIVGLGVLVALSVALTLVPAIILFTGERTFWPNAGKRFANYKKFVLEKIESESGYFSKSGAFAVKHAKIIIILAIVVTLPAAYIYLNTVPTYNFEGGAPSNLQSIQGSNIVSQNFGPGVVSPTYVVVTFNSPIWNGSAFDMSEMSVIQSISSYLVSNPDIQNVTSPTMPNGYLVIYTNLDRELPSTNLTISSITSDIGANNETALVTVNFRINPYSTKAIDDAATIRSYLHSHYGNGINGTTEVYLGGASGQILDTRNTVNAQFATILPIVALGVALVLLIVLGSLFLPVFAVVSILMSIVWTLCVTIFVFRELYNYQLLFITPLFLFVTLLGLGMDYNIFILTRIREEAKKGQKLEDAIVHAIEHTGGIITAAAFILAGSLASLMLSGDLLLKEIGFAFSFSILIDALVVRTYLVPAVMTFAGKWNWYDPIPFLRRSKGLYEQERSLESAKEA